MLIADIELPAGQWCSQRGTQGARAPTEMALKFDP